jgi:hypothetical protein
LDSLAPVLAVLGLSLRVEDHRGGPEPNSDAEK